jgi:hypothetical protein
MPLDIGNYSMAELLPQTCTKRPRLNGGQYLSQMEELQQSYEEKNDESAFKKQGSYSLCS